MQTLRTLFSRSQLAIAQLCLQEYRYSTPVKSSMRNCPRTAGKGIKLNLAVKFMQVGKKTPHHTSYATDDPKSYTATLSSRTSLVIPIY